MLFFEESPVVESLINRIDWFLHHMEEYAGKNITLETLNKICVMCGLQPGDIIEVVPTDEEKIKYKL